MYTNEDKLFYILIAATVIVGGVIGYFLYSMLRQFRHYRKLQDDSDQAKIEALEEERQVIAADLHDDMAPILSAALCNLREIEPVSDQEKKLLLDTCTYIDNLYERVRKISSLMTPHSIGRRGPLHALQEFVELYRPHSMQVTLHPVACEKMPASKSLHLFRMLQEILQNSIRHARASRLTISGEVKGDRLLIETEDDGVGFKVHEVAQRPGIGLQNLAIRARMIGATLRMESSPGRGTKYRIEVSLQDE
jgi:signal transduction histidine kinase